MVHEVTTQRSRGTAGRGIFPDIHAYEKSSVSACLTNLDRFTREGIATRGLRAFVKLAKQRQINAAMPQISQRSHRHKQHAISSRHCLNWQALIEIFAR